MDVDGLMRTSSRGSFMAWSLNALLSPSKFVTTPSTHLRSVLLAGRAVHAMTWTRRSRAKTLLLLQRTILFLSSSLASERSKFPPAL